MMADLVRFYSIVIRLCFAYASLSHHVRSGFVPSDSMRFNIAIARSNGILRIDCTDDALNFGSCRVGSQCFDPDTIAS